MIGWGRLGMLCVFTAVLGCPPLAAEAAPRAFNIPSQPLSSALRAFGLQSGLPIVFSAASVGQGRAPAVVGTLEPETALARLLRGSDLAFEPTGAGFTVLPTERARATAESGAPAPAASPAPGGGAPGPEIAPAPSPSPKAMDAPAVLESVVVTGSSIRGLPPVGSALIEVGRPDIAAAAPANTKELLSVLPQLGNFGVNAEQSTPNRYRTAGYSPNIHNLGAFATLTLFNGHRMAPVGGEAVFPDPSIIPVIAVERVELVADGASSVYGSDAVAGVVNFIYRRNVDGIETQATTGWNGTRYRKRDFGMIGGHAWATGSVMAAYEYSANLSPWNTDIDFLALGGDQRSRGGRDLRSSNCLTPNVTVAGATYAYPAWTPGRNYCGALAPQNIIVDGARHALLVTLRQRVGARVALWGELNASQYDTERLRDRQALNLTVPSTNPFFRTPPGVVADSLSLTRSGLGLFRGALSTQSSDVYGLTLGADIDVGGAWSTAVMLHVSKTFDYNKDPELDMLAAQRLAEGTTPKTALNPFAGAGDNDPAVLAQIDDDYAQINDTSQRVSELQVKGDGPLFATRGGLVRAAAGVALRNDRAIQLQTAGPPGPGLLVVRDDDISRLVLSLFGEVNLPLFGEANARRGLHALSLSISGRFDDYERLGQVFNPKYGAIWSPMAGLSLRSSYGTAFAAPNLGLTTSTFTVPRPNSVLNLRDVTTGIFLGTVNALNPGGGNPALEPETATTRSLGLDLAPPAIPRLRLAATYYAVEYRNTIYTPTNDDILTNPQFAHLRVINPTAQQIADVLARMPPQAPITTGFDAIIYLNARNIGMRQIAGVDLSAAYAVGNLEFGLNANHQSRYRQQIVPGGPFNSRLGASEAPRWKARSSLAWTGGPLGLALFANYVSSFRNTTVTPYQRVDAHLTFDLAVSRRLPLRSGQLELQARIVNLFDRDPPFYDSALGYYPALASPFGRQFEITMRGAF